MPGRSGGERHQLLIDKTIDAVIALRRGSNWVGGWAESSMFNAVHGTVGIGLAADLYLEVQPSDKGGPIVVEVGKMRDGKWANVTCGDGRPVRVLRIPFEGPPYVLNERGDEMESAIMSAVTKATK